MLGGEPVFAGTRVPVKNLVDYLADEDHGLAGFLEGFPSVGRKQTVAFLEWALEAARWRVGAEG